jgi:hypothetical protein
MRFTCVPLCSTVCVPSSLSSPTHRLETEFRSFAGDGRLRPGIRHAGECTRRAGYRVAGQLTASAAGSGIVRNPPAPIRQPQRSPAWTVPTAGGSQGPPDHLVAGRRYDDRKRARLPWGCAGCCPPAGSLDGPRPWDLGPWPARNTLCDHPPRHRRHGRGPGPRSRLQVKNAGR